MIINVAQSSINYLLVHYLSYCEIRSVFSFELIKPYVMHNKYHITRTVVMNNSF